MSKPTIADLAKAAGVSVSTVDRVLNGRNPVRPKTAERIMVAAESIGFYAANVIRQRIGNSKLKRRFSFMLLQGDRSFYQNLANALQQAVDFLGDEISIETEFVFMEELMPSAVAERIRVLGEQSDAIGIVAAEHPLVAQAISQLREQGVPCFGLISSVTTENGVGYIGLDNWKVGRTAAWAFDNLCCKPGKLGIMIGSHRYRNQELNEIGFRSYFREHNSDFKLLEPISSVENRHLAAELITELLEQEPDLCGLYISGGGVTGAMAALRDSGKAKEITVVGYELMDETRAGLLDGTLNFLISHPLDKVAEVTLQSMLEATEAGVDRSEVSLPSVRLPFEIYTSENL